MFETAFNRPRMNVSIYLHTSEIIRYYHQKTSKYSSIPYKLVLSNESVSHMSCTYLHLASIFSIHELHNFIISPNFCPHISFWFRRRSDRSKSHLDHQVLKFPTDSALSIREKKKKKKNRRCAR